jgi:hypothetical protein
MDFSALWITFVRWRLDVSIDFPEIIVKQATFRILDALGARSDFGTEFLGR